MTNSTVDVSDGVRVSGADAFKGNAGFNVNELKQIGKFTPWCPFVVHSINTRFAWGFGIYRPVA